MLCFNQTYLGCREGFPRTNSIKHLRSPFNSLCLWIAAIIGVREGISLGAGRKKFALKITICSKNKQFALKLTFLV